MSRRVSVEEQFARLIEVESSSAEGGGADVATLGRMVAVAGALRAAGAVAGPAPLSLDVKAAMRQRLVAVATVSRYDAAEAAVSGRVRRHRIDSMTDRLHRRLVTLAGSFAVITSVAGVGVAAAHSLPGDPFYGVKRATESVQLWATQGEAAKGKLHLEFARTRLAEAQKLPAHSSHIASTLAAMDSQTEQGTSELLSAYRSSHSTKPIATLVTFTQQQYAGLTTLAQHLPASLQGSELKALTVLTDVTGNLRTATGRNCLSCIVSSPTSPVGSHPSTKPSATSSRTPHPTPSKSASPSGSPGGPAPTPTKTPSSLPTGLVPTNLLPSKLNPSGLLPSLLKKAQHPKPKSSGLISPLLNSLGL